MRFLIITFVFILIQEATSCSRNVSTRDFEDIIRRLELLENGDKHQEIIGLKWEVNELKNVVHLRKVESDDLKLQIKTLENFVKTQKTSFDELDSELKKLRATMNTQNDKINNQERIISSLIDSLSKNNKNRKTVDIKNLNKLQNSKTPFTEGWGKKKYELNTTSVLNLPVSNDKSKVTGNQSRGYSDVLKVTRTSLKNKRNENKRQTDTMIMFEALLDGQFTDLAPKFILKMNNVILNEGNAYNYSDGVFAAMVTGVYMFHCRVTPVLGKEAYIQLMINGKGRGVLHASSTTVFQTTSGTFFAHLNVGDHVWLETVWFTSSLLGGYSAFSGVLLH